MFTPDPFWEADAYDNNDPKVANYAENMRAFSDEARIRIRHQLGAMAAHLSHEDDE